MCCIRSSPLTQLQSQVPTIVRAIQKLLKEKSLKTRQGCFSLLSELVQVLQGALNDHVSAIIPGIQLSLGYVTSPPSRIIILSSFLVELSLLRLLIVSTTFNFNTFSLLRFLFLLYYVYVMPLQMKERK